jgi:hypothetical protein
VKRDFVLKIYFGEEWKFVAILHSTVFQMSRDSSVCIATGYGLDDRIIAVRFPVGLEIFLFDTMSRPALGSTQPMGTVGSFPGGKAAGA